METSRILVVDDEEEICSVTKSFLTKRNFVVFTALNGADALALAKKESPQLVLLDLRLGSESGIDILAKIKEIDKKIRVIMVSGSGDDESICRAKSCGADDYITKPFTAAYLCDVINQKLNKGGA
ncbi:MAG: response regulator [Candidatus Omnitrophica bacterium]|nr:response regulator [Candidatus Omnitrophota bacterium]